MAPSDFKTRREIAALYGHIIPYSRLKKLGMKDCVNGPPVIRKSGRILYHVPTFERWLLEGLSATPPATPPSPPSPSSAPKKRGRPTKAETIRRQQEGNTSKAAEAFDVGAGGVNA